MKLFLRNIYALSALLLVSASLLHAQTDTIYSFGNNNNNIDNNFNVSGAYEDPTNWDNGVPNGLPANGALTYGIIPFVVLEVNNVVTNPDQEIAISLSSNQSADGLIVLGNSFATGTTSSTLDFTTGTGDTLEISGINRGNALELDYRTTMNYSGGTLQIDNGAISIGLDAQGTSILNLSACTVNLAPATGSITSILIGTGKGDSGMMSQSGNSIVNLDIAGKGGNDLFIGTAGGTGTYTIANSTLNIGAGDDVFIGSGGSFVEQDGASVNLLKKSSAIFLGDLKSDNSGSYELQGGALVLNGTLSIGESKGTAGAFAQSGGTFTAGSASTINIGDGGTGSFSLSAGTATFGNGFTVGTQAGSTGTLLVSGGTMTSSGTNTIGVAGTGTFDLSGGTVTLNNGLTLGATGTINQTHGILQIATGQALNSTAGSVYNLTGGILRISGDGVTTGLTGTGTMNLGSAIIQVNGTQFVDTLSGAVTGANTIQANSSTKKVTAVTLDGSLTGAGGLTLLGTSGTVFDLTVGVKSYSGGTTLTGGTLNLNLGNFSSTGNLTINANSTVNLGQSVAVTDTFSGQLLGTGTINTGTNILKLTGTGSFTGNFNIGAGGTLQVFNGNFGNLAGNGSNLLIGGGNGSDPTTGIVTLTGTNTASGDTVVSTGFTLVADSVGGSLIDNGTVVISPATSPGHIFTVNGFMNAPAGSILSLRSNVSGSVLGVDSFNASTTADIDSAFIVSGSGTTKTPIAIVTTEAGGLTYGPDTTVTTQSALLYTASLTHDDSHIYISTVQKPLGTFAETYNEMQVAKPIDRIFADSSLLPNKQTADAFNDVISVFNKAATGDQVANGLEQLSPESLQYARNIAFENGTMMVQGVNNADANIRNGNAGLDSSGFNFVTPVFSSSLGRSMGTFLASNAPGFHQTAPNGVNYYPNSDGTTSPSSSPSSITPDTSEVDSPTSDAMGHSISDSPSPLRTAATTSARGPSFSEFIGGDVILANLNQNQSGSYAPSTKASYTAGDAIAGVSFRMTSNLSTGVLFDYNHTDAKTDGSGSKTKVDSYSPGVFATYSEKGFYVNGLATFGYNNYSNTRNIPFLGETATSSPSGQQYVGDLDFGYDFRPNAHWVAGPTLGLTYTHLDVDSFHEAGAPGASLAVDGQHADSLRSRLGGHVVYQIHSGNILFQPNFSFSWQHEYLDNSSAITSQFRDFSPQSFSIRTSQEGTDSALIGLGMTATLDNSMALYLNYFADVGAEDYFAQSVIGGFKASF